jgi:hypothetical protein
MGLSDAFYKSACVISPEMNETYIGFLLKATDPRKSVKT